MAFNALANCQASLLAERLKVVTDCVTDLACYSCLSVQMCGSLGPAGQFRPSGSKTRGIESPFLPLVQTSSTKGAYTSRCKAFLCKLVH